MPLIDQWQGFNGLPDFSDPPAIPTDLKAAFDFLASRAIPRYASIAARDAELTSPINGQMCWVDAEATLYVYDGGAWSAAHGPVQTGSLTLAAGFTGSVDYRAAPGPLGMDVEIDVNVSGGIPTGTTVLTTGVMPDELIPSGSRFGAGRMSGGFAGIIYLSTNLKTIQGENQGSGGTRTAIAGTIRYTV